MGYLDELLAQFDDATIDQCRHADFKDDFDWNGLADCLALIRRIARGLNQTPEDELPDDVRNNSHQQLTNVINNMVGPIAAFDYASNPQAHQARDSLCQQVTAAVRDFKAFRPHISLDLPDADHLASLREEAAALRGLAEGIRSSQTDAEETLKAAHEALERVQTAAGQAASGQLSRHYRKQVGDHRSLATKFLGAVIIVALILAVASYYLFDGINTGRDESAIKFARDGVARLLLLGLIAYGLAFCSRGYRANTHLAIVNEQKANALDTFSLFQETVTTEAGKEAVTVELVRAVFATSDSGYLQGSADKTIIEEQGSAVLSLLAARR